MVEVRVKDGQLREAAQDMDAFIDVFVKAIYEAIGGQLTAEAMSQLDAEKITLLAWDILHEEMMDGGMVQLIHNGYGAFFFRNPTAKAFREWGLRDLYRLLNRAQKFYDRHRGGIERECTDEQFMELYEKYPEFDDIDDEFVENEEEWTEAVARYVDEHIDHFAIIEE